MEQFSFLKFKKDLSSILYYSNKKICIVQDINDFWQFVKKFETKKGDLSKFYNENNQYINFRIYANKYRPYHQYLNDKQYKEFFTILSLYISFKNNENLTKLKKLRKNQQNLPIAKYRQEIVEAVRDFSVVIIAGDTGCGKSTQVPQYLYEAGYKTIACTQPRRIACISLAKRVSFEMLSQFQSLVGYQIRFEKVKFKNTQIIFLTEGLLIRQLSDATILNNYDVIMIDEVHERHLHSDFLLGIMKCFLYTEYKFKLIIMSATINIQLFIEYFRNERLKFLQIPGKMYQVDIIYKPIFKHPLMEKSSKLDPSPYVQILRIIDEEYLRSQKGDVLIFVPGMLEINTLASAIDEYNVDRNWIVLPLHSSLSVLDQEKVFRPCEDGFRKCIISTNIAETSLTIDGVRFVIDSGRVNKLKYNSDIYVNVLNEENISKDSARQRCGRAGRTGPGICYRLYSQEEFNEFDEYTLAEIHTVSLETLILLMGSFGIKNIATFPFIEKPNENSLLIAFNRLKQLNCIHGEINLMDLTLLGESLSRLPVDLSIGLMLINATIFNLLNSVLIITSILSVQSPYTNKAFRDTECIEKRNNFESKHGDIFSLLNLFTEWLRVKYNKDFGNKVRNSKGWTREIGIEEQRFYEIVKLQNQFKNLLNDCNLIKISNSTNSLSNSERILRKGQLKKLKSLKYKHETDSKINEKSKRKLNIDNYENDDQLNDSNNDAQDIDFQISTDTKSLYKLLKESNINKQDDIEILKLILCSGLFPQIAISDEHNYLKSTKENFYHTKNNNFISMHPMSYYAHCNYDPLRLANDDIIESPAYYSSQNTLSCQHKLLLYQSLMKIKGTCYLSNNTLISAIHSLLLFSRKICTNSILTQILFDDFLLIDLPFINEGKIILMKSISIRKKWRDLLTKKFQENYCNEIDEKSNALFNDLLNFIHIKVTYSLKRVLNADLKVIFSHSEDKLVDDLSRNPFDKDFKIVLNKEIGGMHVADNECEWSNYLKTEMDNVNYYCELCQNEIHGNILKKWIHEAFCC